VIGPSVPPPHREDARRWGAVAVLLAALVIWELSPLWPHIDAVAIGDPDTDAVRGMWGFDHIRRSLIPPDLWIRTSQINFPSGATALILPAATGLLAAPLGLLFGPVVAWNLSVALMLWAAGMATALLVRVAARSWAAGAAAAGALIGQPMLLHAIGDGTPEHVALWGIPLFLALASVALSARSIPLAALAGLAAFIVALDSPYHAVYTAVIAVFVLPVALRPWALRGGGRSERSALGFTVLVLLATAGLGAALLGALYAGFSLEETSSTESLRLLRMNAADLHTWWRFDFGPATVRDPSLAPTTIPSGILWTAIVLGLIGLPRSLPWLLAGGLMLIFSFGLNTRIPLELAEWMGPTGERLGHLLLDLNAQATVLPGLDAIRFPRRWLVPAALSLLVGGSIGLARVIHPLRGTSRRRWAIPIIGTALAAAGTIVGVRTAALHSNFPLQPLPELAFTDWLAEQPPGAALLLPRIRPAPSTRLREDIPVFASISDTLSSADELYIQVRMGRAQVGYPNLKTVISPPLPSAIDQLLRNWDDLTLPALSDRPIPPGATDPRFEPERQRALAELRQAGLRYIAVDAVAYGEEGLSLLTEQLGNHASDQREFSDGTGVVVFTLKPPSP